VQNYAAKCNRQYTNSRKEKPEPLLFSLVALQIMKGNAWLSPRPKHNTIIRYIAGSIKDHSNHYTDIQIFNQAMDSFRPEQAACSECGAKMLQSLSQYPRHLNGAHGEGHVYIQRYQCPICHKTHAVLPDIITPYSPYSLRFKLDAVKAYLERIVSVESLCAELGLAISTLYRWIKKYKDHKALYLGALGDIETPPLGFIVQSGEPATRTAMLKGFFTKFAFSFFQGKGASSHRHRIRQLVPI